MWRKSEIYIYADSLSVIARTYVEVVNYPVDFFIVRLHIVLAFIFGNYLFRRDLPLSRVAKRLENGCRLRLVSLGL